MGFIASLPAPYCKDSCLPRRKNDRVAKLKAGGTGLSSSPHGGVFGCVQGGCLGLQRLAVEAVGLALWGLIQHRPPNGDMAHLSTRVSGPELVTSSTQE